MDASEFFQKAIAAAIAGGHVWPDYAACEAAEESAMGTSGLCVEANNLFGQKAPSEPPPGWNYPSIDMPTWEMFEGERVAVAHTLWPQFPDWTTAFRERMNLLRRVSAYAPALGAESGPAFVVAVSRVWATDPERANNVLAIMADNAALVGSIMNQQAGGHS